MTALPPPVRHRGVAAFLVITFSLTWLPFVPALFDAEPVPVLMPFAPAIAAVVVRTRVTKERFHDLGLRPRLRTVLPWLALGLVWPLAAMPLAVLTASALGVGSPDLGRVDPVQLALWAGASVLAAPVFLGEELGWRGYLQVRVFPGRALVAAVVTGVVWAVWHYPLWLTTLDLPLWMLPLGTVSIVVTSVFLGWIQSRSGSVWAPALGHSTNNTFEASFGATAFTGQGSSVWMPLGPSAVIALAEAAVLLSMVAVGRGVRPRTRLGVRDTGGSKTLTRRRGRPSSLLLPGA